MGGWARLSPHTHDPSTTPRYHHCRAGDTRCPRWGDKGGTLDENTSQPIGTPHLVLPDLIRYPRWRAGEQGTSCHQPRPTDRRPSSPSPVGEGWGEGQSTTPLMSCRTPTRYTPLYSSCRGNPVSTPPCHSERSRRISRASSHTTLIVFPDTDRGPTQHPCHNPRGISSTYRRRPPRPVPKCRPRPHGHPHRRQILAPPLARRRKTRHVTALCLHARKPMPPGAPSQTVIPSTLNCHPEHPQLSSRAKPRDLKCSQASTALVTATPTPSHRPIVFPDSDPESSGAGRSHYWATPCPTQAPGANEYRTCRRNP